MNALPVGLRGWGALLLGVIAVTPAMAERTQAQLTATFKDRDLVRGTAPLDAVSCTVAWVEIVDERRSPDLVGVIGRRGVLAPSDVSTWKRAVLAGLTARGVAVSFDAPPADQTATTAHLTLRLASIDETETTYSGVVMIGVRARGSTGRTLDQLYRGRVSRTAYWSAGVDTMQSAIDGAFANVLDHLAPDLKQVCAA